MTAALPIIPDLHSYSGSDARVFAHFTGFGQETVELNSLQTISWSVYEAKGPARALGHRGVKGYARGIRTIAGSMVLTVVGDNPLRPLLTMFSKADRSGLWSNTPGWSVDAAKNGMGTGLWSNGTYWGKANTLRDIKLQSYLSTLIPPFNLSVVYVNEYPKVGISANEFSLNENPSATAPIGANTLTAPALAWRLSDVEFITEGIVTSINDAITEVTVQFVANEVYPISRNNLWYGEPVDDGDYSISNLEGSRVPNETPSIMESLKSKDSIRPREKAAPRTTDRPRRKSLGLRPGDPFTSV